MTALVIFILIVIGLNLIPQLTKWNFPKVEKAINRILILITVIFVVLTILLFNGYKLKGLYSNLTIGIIFITTTIIYFALVKNSKRKLITVVILVPLILLSLFTLLFGRTIYESKITDGYKIQVTTGGIMSCGELIHLTETEFLIFDKEIVYESSLCLREIKQIETINFDQDSAEFLIYHNGEMDSENPYKYKIENKNVW
ncbi:MAG: hypothetical protein WDZ35_05370 [Crocinitomicaceae bacterium]